MCRGLLELLIAGDIDTVMDREYPCSLSVTTFAWMLVRDEDMTRISDRVQGNFDTAVRLVG